MSVFHSSCLRAAVIAGLLGSSLVAVAAPTASAAAITVTTTADVVNGGDGQTSLREAFSTAGTNGVDDTITLGAGLTYPLTNCGPGPLTHADGHGLVVEGNGSVIEQTCDATAIIDSTDHAGRLELQDLVIDGGPNTTATVFEGAAVRSDSELKLTGVEIRNVLAPNGSVVWSSFDHGTTPYRMTLSGVNLHHNTGSIVSCENCSLQIEGSTISNNTGSGISLVDGYPVDINSSTISNNTRAGISNTGQGFPVNKMTIDLSQISNNGRVGIRCGNCGGLSMYSTNVTDNGLTAADALGGISYSLSERSGTPASGIGIILSTITGNKSTAAGGGLGVAPVLVEDGGNTAQIGLDRVQVENNTSTANGGGVAIGIGDYQSYRGSLKSNTATGDGGGLAFLTPGTATTTLDETEVRDNSAGDDGGGVYIDENASFAAGESAISGNVAGGDGGGISVGKSFQVTLTNEVISNNTAVNGAGMDFAGEVVKFDRTTFAGNKATGSGGGARVSAMAATALNSTFSGNQAVTGGGLSFTTATKVTLTHVTMADDKATTGAHIAAVPSATVTTSRSALVLPQTGTSCAGVGGAFGGVSGGFSVLRDATCGSVASDLVTAADPQLGPLANNPQLTRLPAATSPLGGRVPLANCSTTEDQRLQPRPQGAKCDAGAVEIVEAAAPADPAKELKALILEVKALHLKKQLEFSLVIRLQAAYVAVVKNKPVAAKAFINSFIVVVKAHAGKQIPAAAAAKLVTKATAIRNSL